MHQPKRNRPMMQLRRKPQSEGCFETFYSCVRAATPAYLCADATGTVDSSRHTRSQPGARQHHAGLLPRKRGSVDAINPATGMHILPPKTADTAWDMTRM